jgi:mRNA-degrading endonuclease toxin of MazEF toxin-antitoxin module
MVIQRGELYWIELEPPSGLEPGYSNPHVVIH